MCKKFIMPEWSDKEQLKMSKKLHEKETSFEENEMYLFF